MNYPSISIIIPCYNEADRVQIMFAGIVDFVSQWKGEYEVIIVDDGSTDGTDILITQHPDFMLWQKTQTIRLIHQKNTGKGGALKHGVGFATKDFVLTLDADMATAPIQLLEWLNARHEFQQNEILIGSRELKQSVIREIPYRKFIGNVFNYVIRKSVGLSIHDTQCGFKLYPVSIAGRVFSELQTLGWAHDVELLARAHKLGCKIIEMPVTWTAVPGSKINVVKDSWNMFWEVMRIRKLLRRWRSDH